MNKAIPCIITLAFVLSSVGQEKKPSRPLTHEDYLAKSKHQKTAAWILLGSGVAMEVTGAAWAGSDFESSGPDVLFIAGGACIAGSIPLFIASSKNKKRAMNASASFKLENTSVVHPGGGGFRLVPTVAVNLAL